MYMVRELSTTGIMVRELFTTYIISISLLSNNVQLNLNCTTSAHTAINDHNINIFTHSES